MKVWSVPENRFESTLEYPLEHDMKGVVFSVFATSQQDCLVVCFQAYIDSLDGVRKNQSLLVTYKLSTFQKTMELAIGGSVDRFYPSGDCTRILISAQDEKNQMKTLELYEFKDFKINGKFQKVAVFVTETSPRFSCISLDGQKVCIGLADCEGITFLQPCGTLLEVASVYSDSVDDNANAIEPAAGVTVAWDDDVNVGSRSYESFDATTEQGIDGGHDEPTQNEEDLKNFLF